VVGGCECKHIFFYYYYLQDVIRRFKRFAGWKWEEFAEKNAIQVRALPLRAIRGEGANAPPINPPILLPPSSSSTTPTLPSQSLS
jgi:hypothetical protein